VKRFRFRLAQVLHVRRVQEDQAKAAVLVANRAAHGEAMLVERRLSDYRDRSMPTGAHSYETFERALFLLDTAAGAVTSARAAHREALAVVAEKRAAYEHAHRRVAALERLETRRREEYEIEMRRAEDRLVDDLVVARHARNQPALVGGKR
jgi:flagellar export protein FliJ